jgi:lipopolysaccharide transport system permease protein
MKNNSFISVFKRLYEYRVRLFEGVYHDVKQRYAGSIFGLFWAIAFPLAQLTIYAVLYAVIFKIRPSGLTEMGYVLLVFSGLVPLLMYNEGVATAIGSLTSNKTLLSSTVFPVELIPVRTVLSAQTPSFFGLLITLILGFILGKTSYQALIMIPILWILLLMFMIGLSWMLSLFALVLKDIQNIFSLVTMMMIFLSPFAYTPDMVPSGLQPIIYLNPLSYYVIPFQQVIAYGSWPDLHILIVTFLISTSTFIVGLKIFTKSKGVFFDYA